LVTGFSRFALKLPARNDLQCEKTHNHPLAHIFFCGMTNRVKKARAWGCHNVQSRRNAKDTASQSQQKRGDEAKIPPDDKMTFKTPRNGASAAYWVTRTGGDLTVNHMIVRFAIFL
jgi:hypothetical protein